MTGPIPHLPQLPELDPAMDFAAVWNRTVRQHRDQRWREEQDVSFWERHAGRYDQQQPPTPATHQALAHMLEPQMTLLDVGAGTGRYALPASFLVREVTAIDHARAMLSRLQDQVEARAIGNIRLVQDDYHTAPLQTHDVVLAAWSLYSSADLNTSLTRLLALSRQRLILLDDDNRGSVHRQIRQALWPKPDQGAPFPKHLFLLGALRQLGVQPRLQMIQEIRQIHFQTETELLDRLCPAQAREPELSRFRQALAPYLDSCDGGLLYRAPFQVAMIRVDRQR